MHNCTHLSLFLLFREKKTLSFLKLKFPVYSRICLTVHLPKSWSISHQSLTPTPVSSIMSPLAPAQQANTFIIFYKRKLFFFVLTSPSNYWTVNYLLFLFPMCTHAKLLQSCPTLCNSMDYSLPGSSVHGIFQARILEWIAISFSRGSSWPRDLTQVSCLASGFFTTEPLGKPLFSSAHPLNQWFSTSGINSHLWRGFLFKNSHVMS